MKWMCILLLLTISCGGGRDKISCDIFENIDDSDFLCEQEKFPVESPLMPQIPEINEAEKYKGSFINCKSIPKGVDDKISLKEGCYTGCITFSGKISIIGEGSGKTIIICNQAEVDAVVKIEQNSKVEIANLSLKGLTRGIFVEKGSDVIINEVVISESTKGGINICGGESECESNVVIQNSVIENIIPEKGSNISYGVSSGTGYLKILKSSISGFNSFGVALWGEEFPYLLVAEIENSYISDIFQGIREYEGHAVYAEGNVNLSVLGSSIKNSSSSFLYFSSFENDAKLSVKNVVMENIINVENEQGGLVLDGKINVELEQVLIKNSRGSGIFTNGSEIRACDLTIDTVFSNGLMENGFGIMIFDSSNVELNRIFLTSAQIASIFMDGGSNVVIKDFQILNTRSDQDINEFGIGVAVQEESEIIMENGIINGNREAGIMAVNGKVRLRNVEISNTLPRECFEKKSCSFAPDIPFGHGISLYNKSLISIDNISILNNNNGLNVENSKIQKQGTGKAKFIKNKSAVNAWNISNFNEIERNLLNSEYCENQTVFTTDVQPVRNGL